MIQHSQKQVFKIYVPSCFGQNARCNQKRCSGKFNVISTNHCHMEKISLLKNLKKDWKMKRER